MTEENKEIFSSFSDDSGEYWLFWCQGCKTHHAPSKKRWTLTGTLDSPTLSPSIVSDYGLYGRCHLYVREGKLVFLGDCTKHSLSNQTLPMLPLP